MPNNPDKVTTIANLHKKKVHMSGRVYCDTGIYFGATAENFNAYERVNTEVFGLKVYMNHTTGNMLVDNKTVLERIFQSWPGPQPILVHAEADMLEMAIGLAKKYQKRLHACHVSLGDEIRMIKKAKINGLPITCEVTCHHLFLTDQDVHVRGAHTLMKPPLATQKDVDTLWENLDVVDFIASDHAPHTHEEKKLDTPPYGIPGLETSLPLMLTALAHKRLSFAKMQDMMTAAPRRIFNIPQQHDTYIEVDPEEKWVISSKNTYTKCQWSPFDGTQIQGRLKKVVLRGKTVYESGEIIGGPTGKVVMPYVKGA